jgi:hypothetical protein
VGTGRCLPLAQPKNPGKDGRLISQKDTITKQGIDPKKVIIYCTVFVYKTGNSQHSLSSYNRLFIHVCSLFCMLSAKVLSAYNEFKFVHGIQKISNTRFQPLGIEYYSG